MSFTLNSPQVSAAITGNITGGPSTAQFTAPLSHKPSKAFVVGSSAGQVNKSYSNDHVIASSGSALSLDLTSLTDPIAGAVSFSVVTSILITNNSTNAGEDVTVGGGTTPLFAAEGEPIQANGGFVLINNPNPGITVTGASTNLLKLATAAGTNVPVTISILGH